MRVNIGYWWPIDYQCNVTIGTSKAIAPDQPTRLPNPPDSFLNTAATPTPDPELRVPVANLYIWRYSLTTPHLAAHNPSVHAARRRGPRALSPLATATDCRRRSRTSPLSQH